MPLRTSALCVLALTFAVLAPAPAAVTQASGTFQADDEIAAVPFRVTTSGPVSIVTGSYVPGGFSPVFSLFFTSDNDRLFAVAFGNQGVCGDGVTPPPNGICEDIRWTGFLMPGLYLATLTVFPNLPNGPGLADGFLLQGGGNFTSLFGGTGPFLEPNGENRTGDWNLTISGGSVSAVPEPRAAFLVAAGLLFIRFHSARGRHPKENRP